jgi:hypothetical protein
VKCEVSGPAVQVMRPGPHSLARAREPAPCSVYPGSGLVPPSCGAPLAVGAGPGPSTLLWRAMALSVAQAFVRSALAPGAAAAAGPLPPELAAQLSVADKVRIRDRSTIMARHLYADHGDKFADLQVKLGRVTGRGGRSGPPRREGLRALLL